MDLLKFIVLVLVAVFAQVYVALGSPLSSEEDGEMWTLEDWQVRRQGYHVVDI